VNAVPKHRVALLPISHILLKEFLKLPEHMQIVGVREQQTDRSKQQITFLVASPFCPEVEFMGDIPEIDLHYQESEDGRVMLVTVKGLDT
jgi:hypothetical protein